MSETGEDVKDWESDVYRVLLRMVLPAGTGFIAFTQIPGTSPTVGWVLMGIAVVTIFIAFNQSVKMADDRLNHGGM